MTARKNNLGMSSERNSAPQRLVSGFTCFAAHLVLPGGLHAFDPATGTSTRLIVAAVDQQVRLGSVNPTLPVVQSIAVLGPKRLLVSGGGGQLLLVTLP